MELYIFMLLLISTTFSETNGANILVVFPHVSRNHFKATTKLVTSLEIKGHNVTLVCPYKLGTKGDKNITEVHLYDIVEPIERFKTNFFETHDPESYWSSLKYTEELGYKYASNVLTNKNVTDLIKSNSFFDLVLVEDVSADALTIFSYIFKCPLVVLLSEPLSLFYDNYFFRDMDWLDNIMQNGHRYVIKEFYRKLIILPQQNKIIQDIIPDAPDIREILYNTSLVLIPSYPALSKLIPRYFNVKQIGGFHIDNQKHEVPEDIENFLNNSKKGVIVIVISNDIKENETNLELFLILSGYDLFRDILWESNTYGGEILGHPNVKLFIGNGDIYETSQAIYNKIPVINLIYNKWFQRFLMGNKIILELPINFLEFEILQYTIEETLLMNNTRYHQNIKFFSDVIYMEQNNSPSEEAVFWIENVIKFNGISEFRPEKLHLQLRNHLIYIIVILAIVDILLFLLFYWIIKHFPQYMEAIVNKGISWIKRHKNNNNSKPSVNYIRL